jgi:molecular chaperone GrpE
MNKKNQNEVTEHDMLESTEKEITVDLQQQNQEYLAGWQRAKADYLNLKKETDDIIGNLRKSISTDLFVEFLSLWQHILTAIAHIPEDLKNTDWAQGFRHSQKQIEHWLEDNGITRIYTLGEKFNYEKFEAVDTVWDVTKPPDIVVSERAPGYERQGNVIVHPKVVVNTAPTDEIPDK